MNMEKIKEVSEATFMWLLDIPIKHWSRHAFGHSVKNEHIINNMIESFENKVNMHRNEPILSLLEYVRQFMMNKIRQMHENELR